MRVGPLRACEVTLHIRTYSASECVPEAMLCHLCDVTPQACRLHV